MKGKFSGWIMEGESGTNSVEAFDPKVFCIFVTTNIFRDAPSYKTTKYIINVCILCERRGGYTFD